MVGIDPERPGVGVERRGVDRLEHDLAARPQLLGRERDEVDDVLRRQVLDHLDHHDAAEAAGLDAAQVVDREALLDVEPAAAGAGDQLLVGLDAAHA